MGREEDGHIWECHSESWYYVYSISANKRTKNMSRKTSWQLRTWTLNNNFYSPFRVAIIRDAEHRSVSEVVSFTTPGCEPDPPLAPTLISRTKNSLNLQWKVRILLSKESQCDLKTLCCFLNFDQKWHMLHLIYFSTTSLHYDPSVLSRDHTKLRNVSIHWIINLKQTAHFMHISLGVNNPSYQ